MTIEGWEVVADVVGHLAWPLLVLAVILMFRTQIATFIAEIEEAGWGDGKVKRGNQRSFKLKQEAADTEPSVAPVLGADGTPAAADAAADLPVVRALGERQRLIMYYARVVVDRLRTSKYNTDTTSARLGAEIVGNTYADLKQAVRFIAFALRDSGGTRGVIPGVTKNLEVLALPDDLDHDIREARQFAHDVTERRAKVDGQGAADYIDVVRSLVTRLMNWSVAQLNED
jgi:hypothetical protein